MSASLKVKRSTVVGIYTLLGFGTAVNWNPEILKKKTKKIPELDMTSVTIEDAEMSKDLDELIDALTKNPDVELEFVNDITVAADQETTGEVTKAEPAAGATKEKAKTEPKPKKEKKEPAPAAPKKPTVSHLAGVVLKNHAKDGMAPSE